MRILGIDPALKITGYGVIEIKQKKLSLFKAGAIITSTNQTLPARLEKIYRAVENLISLSRPEVMVLEKVYAHYRHPFTAFILGQARGVVCLLSAENKIPLVEYAATQVKKSIVGRGLASKHQVQRMVMNALGLNTLPRFSDVTDALALAITYANLQRAKI